MDRACNCMHAVLTVQDFATERGHPYPGALPLESMLFCANPTVANFDLFCRVPTK